MMSPHLIQDLLKKLQAQDAAKQAATVRAAAAASFGRVTAPAGDRSHRWEVELYGICGDGATLEEATANWKRLARRVAEIEDDGFVSLHPNFLPAT